MTKREIVNPVLIITGSLTIISGLILWLHLKSRPVATTHEIGGLIFVVACLIHAIINWKPMVASLKMKGMTCMVVASLLIGGLGLIYSGVTADQTHSGRGHTSQISSR